MNLALTAGEWTGETAPYCHAAVCFSGEPDDDPANGQTLANYWLRITLLTADATPKTITVLNGPITVKDGPVGAGAAVPLGNVRFWTDGAGNVQLQLRNVTDGLFYTVGISDIGGVPTLFLGDTGM